MVKRSVADGTVLDAAGIPAALDTSTERSARMKWGILGPGRIARSFLTGLAGSATETAVAVGQPGPGRARAVADDFDVPRAYGSYEDLLADDEVEAVYVGAAQLAARAVVGRRRPGRQARALREAAGPDRRRGRGDVRGRRGTAGSG